MHLAAKNRLMPITKLLLNHGADVDARSKSGNTVLLDVSQWGYYEIVDSLIESKADVNATGKNGITALMQASYYGNTEIVRLLLAHQADANAKAAGGMTSLMFASQNGDLEIAKILLSGGAEVDAKDSHGITALMHASQDGQTEIVELLLGSGADVNSKTRSGGTALHKAARHGHEDIVELLLTESADVHAKDFYGYTALSLVQCSAFNPFSMYSWCPFFVFPGLRIYNHAVVDILERAAAVRRAGSAHKHAIERFYRIVDETGIKTRFEELSEELGVKSEEDLEYIQEDDLTNILKEMKVVPERKLRAALKAVHNEL
mmetsp:Transcript_33557/g.56902  ORF Transcript_33557/g.56902 Transcript_33557/m.56902 type:complete len:318 (-) Transcript_33557:178-1131(-)